MQKIKMTVTYSAQSEALRSKTGDMKIFASVLEENLVEYPLLTERKHLACIGDDVRRVAFQSANQNTTPKFVSTKREQAKAGSNDL
jgi:hypothetical protein